eukprot:jgi/Chlat1/6631/Chrsp482S00881
MVMADEGDHEDDDMQQMDDGRGEDGGEESGEEAEDDDMEQEEVDEAQLQALADAVEANPLNYQAHVDHLNALRKAGQLDKLRAAREAMAALFPLTPQMWLDWSSDEARLVTRQESDREQVEQLFERGTSEYLSVELWVAYLEFVEENDPLVAGATEEGSARMRTLYERAITAAGLHVAKGGLLWTACREYEEAMLLLKQSEDTPASERAQQVDKVRSLFRRQLSVPLHGNDTLLVDYQEWEKAQSPSGDIPSHVAAAIKSAERMYTERAPFELLVSDDKPVDAVLLQHYNDYISFEEKAGNPARVQILFERVVVHFAVTPELWMRYTEYVRSHLKIPPVVKNVHSRATRNCPWASELWCRYLRALERINAPDAEQSDAFEQAIAAGFITGEEYVAIFLPRLDALRRKAEAAKQAQSAELDASLSALRDLFRRALELLKTYFPDFVDRSLQLHSYWSDLEVRLAGSMSGARAVWDDLVKERGWLLEAWQGYIAMERAAGNFKECRSIYRRCYTRQFEDPGKEYICTAWLRFERECGSVDEYDAAAGKVAARLAELAELRRQQEAKAAAEAEVKTKRQEKPAQHKEPVEQAKRKRPGLGLDKRAEGKRPRVDEQPAATPAAPSTEDTANGAAGPSGVDHVQAPEGDGDVGNGGAGDAHRKPVYEDKCTAYVSNIAFEAAEPELRELFAPCGVVKDVRIIRLPSGKSKGRAYVDFETDEALQAAVALNGTELHRRPLNIAKSAPPGLSSDGARGERGQERGQDRGGGSRGRGSGRGRGAAYGTALRREEGGTGAGRGRLGGGAFPVVGHRRGGVKLTGSGGRGGFLVPRAVRPSGRGTGAQGSAEDQTPKSNADFRKMLGGGDSKSSGQEQ